MPVRDYSFIADTDSLEALRQLRRGWAGWVLTEGEVHVRLRDGGTVRAHVDAAVIEPGFEVSCLVADFLPDQADVPARESAFSSDANDVALFRGVTWLEPRPDLGPGHTIQFSAIPGFPIPDGAVASCQFTDAVAITTDGGAMVVRLALRPGWLEVLEEPAQVAEFLSLRGFA